MSTLNHTSQVTIKQWEEASESLMATLNNYTEMYLDLAHGSFRTGSNSRNLETRVDSMLNVVSIQLLKTRGIILHTRNQLIPLIHRLPEEVLATIFTHVVFGCNRSDISDPPSIERNVCLIYRRLYTLLGVCSTWRDTILTRGTFWSIIPIITNPSTNEQYPFELSLQRARGHKLCLAAVTRSPDIPRDLVELLAKDGPRFHTINVSIKDRTLVRNVVDKLLRQDVAGSLANLSIRDFDAVNSPWLPGEEDYAIRADDPRQTLFASLVGGLTAFHINGVYFHWHTMTFSTRLVELHIQTVILGYDSEIVSFLRALSSASELRNLKIIAVDTFLNSDSLFGVEFSPPVVLPNLELLHLQDIYFNTLKSLLQMIARGSYRVILFLENLSLKNNLRGGDFAQDLEPRVPNIGDLNSTLAQVPVDTLMLSGDRSVWLTGGMLREVMKAMPTLKTLKIHNWSVDQYTWESLTRHRDNHTGEPEPSFPALERLYLSVTTILSDESCQDMVNSHPLQQVILGGTISYSLYDTEWPSIENSHLSRWLSGNVPEFCLVDREYCPPEFRRDTWKLW